MDIELPDELSEHDLLSPQEFKLMGSSPNNAENYKDGFYTPVAIQNGHDRVKIQKLRGEVFTFKSVGSIWEGVGHEETPEVYLAPLTPHGELLYNPRSVNGYEMLPGWKEKFKMRDGL